MHRLLQVRLRTCLPLLGALWILGAFPALSQVVRGGALPPPLPLLPPDNWWNADVSQAPVDPNSDAFISFIGPTRALHPDMGGDASTTAPDIYGMIYIVVPGTQPLETMAFDYPTESDYGAPGRPAGYPIPVEAKTQDKWIEGGYRGNCDTAPVNSPCQGDKHMLIVDRDNRFLFETWNTRCLPAGSSTCSWRAGSGAVWPLDTNLRRSDTWTSADAAGLAILPGLIRYDEAYGTDSIKHAFRFTVRDTNGYVFPASHQAGSRAGAPPMGMRMRLKASTNISGFAAPVQKIFQAMKTYGLIVADNGSDMYIQGTYDTRWDMDLMNTAFGQLHANDFEVIQLGWTAPSATGALAFYALTPCRILDTRNANGPLGGPALAATGSPDRIFALASAPCGIPAAARAVSLNVTVTGPAAAGFLTFYPGDESRPTTSTISFRAGQTRANNSVMKVTADGQARVAVSNSSQGTAHLVVDVNGYFR